PTCDLLPQPSFPTRRSSDLQSQRKCFPRDEACLRHRTIYSVDQEQNAIDHGQHALHLAAEVGMAGCVNDVDVRAVVSDRAVLREDRKSTRLNSSHQIISYAV